MLTPSRPSNFRDHAPLPLRHVYVTATMHAAAWGAQLARGDAEPRVYVVEPTGEIEDDPNVTDTRFPGNPHPLLPHPRSGAGGARAGGLAPPQRGERARDAGGAREAAGRRG